MRRLILAPLLLSTLAMAEASPPLDQSVDLEAQALSLADAIAFARQSSPRLRAARAAIERARGEEQAAFAPFLPEVDLLSQSGVTSDNQGPGATGPTGFIRTGTPGTHAYTQTELQLQWTLYDFGRRAGRKNQAAARERIAELQFARAQQTVEFDVTAAYVNILLARASLVVQEDAIRQAEATLKDARAQLKGGVADPSDVLRAEVQLSESRDAAVNAREAELVAIAQLNNVMGRDSALPLRVLDLDLPPPERLPSLAESLQVAAAHRPESGFARQAVVAAQEGVATAKAERAILDAISLEVNRAFQSVVAAGQRIDLSRPAVAHALENLRLMRVKYVNGDATPTDIVDAETALTRSRQRLNSAVYTYLVALARLDYAIGREQRPRGSP